ncbi:hypothetical protein CJF12_18085 [Chryseobacterium piperi]|uniref:hypothetical protein n=1 Tax=Chryseobacterium piperi TaxID=558152 RepID=UPI000A6C38B4|nr:hypothetical protein [Chryseobacterium piperi]ASW75986.1 hypothetical protein CJF12_18085 [Chryseobacterium piperi]
MSYSLEKRVQVPEIICENLPRYGVVVVEIDEITEDATGIENPDKISLNMFCINCILKQQM